MYYPHTKKCFFEIRKTYPTVCRPQWLTAWLLTMACGGAKNSDNYTNFGRQLASCRGWVRGSRGRDEDLGAVLEVCVQEEAGE